MSNYNYQAIAAKIDALPGKVWDEDCTSVFVTDPDPHVIGAVVALKIHAGHDPYHAVWSTGAVVPDEATRFQVCHEICQQAVGGMERSGMFKRTGYRARKVADFKKFIVNILLDIMKSTVVVGKAQPDGSPPDGFAERLELTKAAWFADLDAAAAQ